MKKNSLLVYFYDCKNKEDIVKRFDKLLEDLHFDENGNLYPDNMIAHPYFEYDVFPQNVEFMAELLKVINEKIL